MLSLTGLLFVNNKQEEVYAASFDDINHSGGTGFNAESITWAEYDDYKNSVINLYDNGSDTLNHYNVKINTSSSNKPASASRKFEGSKLYLAFGGWLVKNSVSYTVDTTITLPSYIVGNPNFTIKLATSSCSAIAKINDSESLEFTGSQISSPNIKVSFEQSYSGSAATNLAVLEVNSPQIILTTTDIKAPKINFGNDTQTSGGRIINFSVTDDNGSGIKYVKFNGETYTNVSESFIAPVIIVITAISIFIGSSIGNFNMKKNGLLNGAVIGGVYLLSIYLLSGIINHNFVLNIQSIIIIISGIICGMFGGIIGVNKGY